MFFQEIQILPKYGLMVAFMLREKLSRSRNEHDEYQ